MECNEEVKERENHNRFKSKVWTRRARSASEFAPQLEVRIEMGSGMNLELGLELGQGVIDGVGGRTEFCSDGVCLEF